MRLDRTFACVLTVGVLGPLATAQDYGDRDSDTVVRTDSVVTASIVGFAGGDWHALNADGYAEVPISSYNSPVFVDIGQIEVETTGQTDVVEAAWSEVVFPDGRYLHFTYRTQNGLQFVPFSAEIGGQPIQAYTYEMGGDGNGVDFRWWVSQVLWEELTISYSSDGGQTVFSDPTIYDPISGAAWGGTDALHLGLAFPGDGVNWIQATYKIDAVPAPASALLMLGGGAMALRRRRR